MRTKGTDRDCVWTKGIDRDHEDKRDSQGLCVDKRD